MASDLLNHIEDINPDWTKMEKPILCIDFDGVISEYKNGWQGAGVINEAPIKNGLSWIAKATEYFTVMIFSSRCNHPDGIMAMKFWMADNGMEPGTVNRLRFQPGKPSWFVHIDDRAIAFTGSWDALPHPSDLRKDYTPWYYNEPEWNRQRK